MGLLCSRGEKQKIEWMRGFMEERITLDYGSGGKKTSALIEEMLVPAFANEKLAELGDGAVLDLSGPLAFSTDSFVVSPWFFPGGDIGKLAVCGTVNDVAMCGGEPRYLSLSFIIEEGFLVEDLKRIIRSIADTAKSCGVAIVTGDTKVVERGKGDGIYINTSGVGAIRLPGLSPRGIRSGDKVLITGTVGDHGCTIMAARDELIEVDGLQSDCQPLTALARSLWPLGADVRVLRDPTRGGVATTLNEFTEGREITIELDEAAIPVRPEVRGACEILGLDPLYCANEGKMLAVVAPERAEEALTALRQVPGGEDAACIGTVTENYPGRVVLKTAFGGKRILTKLTGAQLPRIC